MPSPLPMPPGAFFDEVLDRVRDKVHGDHRDAALTFARRYLAGLTIEDFAPAVESSEADASKSGKPDANDTAGAICSLLELALRRVPGGVSVRILNPTRDANGWQCDHTVVEVVGDDMPFLVDSVAAALNRRGLDIHQLIHPQMVIKRDEQGRLEAVREPTDQNGDTDADSTHAMESMMHIETDQQGGEGILQQIQDDLVNVFGDVRAAVADWPAMRARAQAFIDDVKAHPARGSDEDYDEALNFLSWVLDNHFTFLGCCDYRLADKAGRILLEPVAPTALGTVAHGEERLRRNKISSERFLEGPKLLRIAKSTRRSRVHRPVHMDLIAMQWRNEAGAVIGERRILGLFTSRAYSIPVREIPLLQRKVANVLTQSGYLPRSHDYKALRAILEQYPRDELFQIREADLARFAARILSLQIRPRPALMVRYDEANRYVSCMVFVPRDGHSTEQRLRIQSLLETEFEGEVTAQNIRLSDRPLALLHFIVRLKGRQRDGHDLAMIERRIESVARSWSDELKRALTGALGEEAGLVEWRRYRDAFPLAYREQASIETTLEDIRRIDEVLRTGKFGVRLDRRLDAEDRLIVRTYERGEPSPLSRYLPVLENLGLEALTEIPFEVRPEDAVAPLWVRAFDVRAPSAVDLEAVRTRFHDAYLRVWGGDIENDRFQRLILGADLSWRQIVILRAYARYLQQVGIGFSQRLIAETLERHASITRDVVDLFFERLDPRRQDDEVDDRIEALETAIHQKLDGVARVDEDRILRRMLDLVEHTLRTNYFQSTDAGNPKRYLSIKLDTSRLEALPLPRPRFEVFVYSPRFEAVHLRGSVVARGGIRWSDRREDYRSEILGLVKAQMVKNAVIVPGGAKGGFVLKQPPSDRAAQREEAETCYRQMMRGLLDLTDNLEGGVVVPPPDVVRRDDDDPYLVVAADKGTATFSDLANAVAAEYGFWLGDAFASGGSAGYDHKKMGITARGAWESVKEHGRHLDMDVEADPLTAVGVGDMSGDVFGNGMLLSRTTRLVGAFNHLHIFVDPDPDPERSFAERERLFAMPRSNWAAYDEGALSEGGAVFDRTAKRLKVSDQVKARFGLTSTEVTPVALMRAILSLDVDLLWFGGIGTYVKAAHEGHAEVADRANDEVRLDAAMVRARMIGEGANLGVTQAGRVAYALRGGLLNTDFIDNAGGVDCSDHEVNIKIALADAVAAGRLDAPAREALLESMTDAVGTLVLRDNRQQARAISVAVVRGASHVDEHQRMMQDLERAEKLDRDLEGLPNDEALAERATAGRPGLTRPEMSVLLAHAKINLTDALLASDLPSDPWLADDLVRYFPEAMREDHMSGITGHRLRRELVATQLANSVVNRMGPSFAGRSARAFGRAKDDVARAYVIARDVFAIREMWEAIEAPGSRMPHVVQIELGLEVARLTDRATRWLLRYTTSLDIGRTVDAYRPSIHRLAKDIEQFLPSDTRAHLRRRETAFVKRGAPKRLASLAAALVALPAGFDIVRVARATEADVETVARVYFKIGERFAFDRLRRAARKLKVKDRWQRLELVDVFEDLEVQQAQLTQLVVADSDESPRRALASWCAANAARVEHFDRLYDEAKVRTKIDVTLLAVLTHGLRRLAEV